MKITDSETLPEPQAVYIFKLSGGDFGACRIIRKGTWHGIPAVLAGPCVYKGRTRPDLEDPGLRQILRIRYYPGMQNVVLSKPAYRGEYCLLWMRSPTPDQYTLLGRIDASPDDEQYNSTSLGIEWPFADIVYLQHLYESDRGEFEKAFRIILNKSRKDQEDASVKNKNQ